MQQDRVEDIKKNLENPVVEEVVNVVLGFAQKLSGKKYYPYQREVGANIIRHVIAKTAIDLSVLLSRQSGKLQWTETPILTPDKGWVKVIDLKVGDYVFHNSGNPTKIIAKSKVVTDADCYRVTTTDGRELLVGGEHLWTVDDRRFCKKYTCTTKELLEKGLHRNGKGSRRVVAGGKEYFTNEYRFHLPEQGIVNLPDRELPIDPYLLGAWLGDGTAKASAITSHKDDVPYIVKEIKRAGFIASIKGSRENTRTVGLLNNLGKSFTKTIKEYSLYGNKHVPEQFLLSGNSQREALLQGLLDTDGHITPKKGTIEFCNTNLNLAKSVLFLARSLGWRAVMGEGRATIYGKDCGPKYRVCFTPTKEDKYCPFRLPRKKEKINEVDGNKGRKKVSIKSIEAIDTIPMQCFTVESEDGLYLAGEDLMVTHNSVINYEVAAAMMVILPELARVYEERLPSIKRFDTNFAGAGTGGIRIGVYAPIFQQAQVIFLGVKTILSSDNGLAVLNSLGVSFDTARGDTVLLSNNSRISCNSAGVESKVESATHDLIILDEAQDIETKVIAKSISPMRNNTGGNMIYVGTCGAHRWDFYETIIYNKNKELEDGIQRHFQFDYNYCSKYNLDYKHAVEDDIEKRGFDSDFVKMNYRLIWMLERGQFCTPQIMFGTEEWIGKGMTNPNLSLVRVRKGARCYAGIDFGKESDSTVVTILEVVDSPIRRGVANPEEPFTSGTESYYVKNILNWLEIYGDDYESQYWEIIEFLRNYSIDKMCVDATSQGDPVADRFITYLTNIEIEPIKFSEKQNSEMFKFVMQEMMAGRLKVPYDYAASQSNQVKKFVQQMLDLEKEYKGQYLKVRHPNVRGAHDDFFSSLALATWATIDGTLPEVEGHSITIFGGSNPHSLFRKKEMPFVSMS